MASSKGTTPGVILPTVPSVGSTASPRATKGSSRVVHVPKVSSHTRGVKAPRVKQPRMPKDANLLFVPQHKRIAKTFSTKLRPVI
jgi:hypothetical protein